MTRDPRLVEVPIDHISHVSRLVSEIGLVAAAQRLRLSRTAVLGVLATGRSMPGTASILREACTATQRTA